MAKKWSWGIFLTARGVPTSREKDLPGGPPPTPSQLRNFDNLYQVLHCRRRARSVSLRREDREALFEASSLRGDRRGRARRPSATYEASSGHVHVVVVLLGLVLDLMRVRSARGSAAKTLA